MFKEVFSGADHTAAQAIQQCTQACDQYNDDNASPLVIAELGGNIGEHCASADDFREYHLTRADLKWAQIHDDPRRTKVGCCKVRFGQFVRTNRACRLLAIGVLARC